MAEAHVEEWPHSGPAGGPDSEVGVVQFGVPLGEVLVVNAGGSPLHRCPRKGTKVPVEIGCMENPWGERGDYLKQQDVKEHEC